MTTYEFFLEKLDAKCEEVAGLPHDHFVDFPVWDCYDGGLSIEETLEELAKADGLFAAALDMYNETD
jgi:hypothetical protein